MFTGSSLMALVAPMMWGKGDYINYNYACYGQADQLASMSSNYGLTWIDTSSKCLGTLYCPTSAPLKGTSAWGKNELESFIWGCFGKGDTAATGQSAATYKPTWNTAVNTCLASMC